MKATISFDLDTERGRFNSALNAEKYESEAYDLYNDVRSYLKHGETTPEKSIEMLEKCKYFLATMVYGED